eukprot:364582-Chlamydomonas_euryale.AAC.8
MPEPALIRQMTDIFCGAQCSVEFSKERYEPVQRSTIKRSRLKRQQILHCDDFRSQEPSTPSATDPPSHTAIARGSYIKAAYPCTFGCNNNPIVSTTTGLS